MFILPRYPHEILQTNTRRRSFPGNSMFTVSMEPVLWAGRNPGRTFKSGDTIHPRGNFRSLLFLTALSFRWKKSKPWQPCPRRPKNICSTTNEDTMSTPTTTSTLTQLEAFIPTSQTYNLHLRRHIRMIQMQTIPLLWTINGLRYCHRYHHHRNNNNNNVPTRQHSILMAIPCNDFGAIRKSKRLEP